MSVADIISGATFPEQDHIVLGGMKSPGKATITSGALERKWDVREPYGASGGSTVYHGDKIRKCDVLIELWEKEHFAEWERFAKTVLFKKPGQFALSIDHPVLKLLDITEVQVESVTAFEQDDYGLWSCTIHLLEFRRPKPAIAKPIAAIPNAPVTIPTAQDAAELEIQKLRAQFEKLL
ncbi:MAG: hypothetical protein KF795_00295 [Labilithrix sp.]|nr:hypothetical protein [Labilithrix sp.]